MTLHISFKKKVVLVIVGVMLFFGALATITVYGMTQRTISMLAVRYLESVVIQQEATIAGVFKNSRSFVSHLAAQEQIITYMEQGDPQLQDGGLLKNFAAFDVDHQYQAIYVIDMTGKTLTSTDPSFVGQNYGFRTYFKKAAAGEPTIDAAIGVTSKKFGYYFSYPIKTSEDEIVGVMVAKLKDDQVGAALLPKILSADGAAMMIDEYGVVLQSSKPELLYKSFEPLSPESQQAITETRKFGDITILPLQYEPVKIPLSAVGQSAAFDTYDAQHQRDEIVGVAQVEDTPFLLLIEETAQSFAAAAGRVAGVVSIFMALSAVGAALLLFLFVARLLRPLTTLKEAAARLGKGDLGQVITIETGDEFEDLSAAFNIMIAKLNDIYANMEGKVWQRTADFEKFRLAVEVVSDSVIITDIDGRILYANKAGEAITGYTQTEMIGSRPSLWGNQMPVEFYEQLWNTIKRDKKEFHGEVTNKRKDGERYVAELHIAPILMEKGKLYGFVGIERDITSRKEADKAKTEFVSVASHQLRTPLAVINWYIEMLKKGEVGTINKEQSAYLEQIHVASQRMVDLVNSLLSVSRIDLGKFDIEPEPLALSVVADETLSEMDPQIQGKHLRIIKQYDQQVPFINADPSMIRVIFQNLISNAVKYTPQNGTITLVIEKGSARDALISVADTGYGIPTGQQSRIFEKFFRADNAREKEPDGNGLGLYITKSIVDRANGKIWFDSKEGRGTTFYVSIPLTGMEKREK